MKQTEDFLRLKEKLKMIKKRVEHELELIDFGQREYYRLKEMINEQMNTFKHSL